MTNYKIKTHFEGYINDVKFDNEDIYKIVYELLEKLIMTLMNVITINLLKIYKKA